MKRLLRIGFDMFITSFTPIIIWFFVGIILDKNLSNVFTLTYPLQCFMGMIVAIFGVGASATTFKDKNKNGADNGIFYGTIISILIFTLIALNVDKYINFMNMDISIYRTFCIYSIIQIMFMTILYMILMKLYYFEENKKANRISLVFSLVNFVVLISMMLITKNQVIICLVTLIILGILVLYFLFNNVKKVDFKLNLVNCFKYNCVSFCLNLIFLVIYLFGFSNSFSYGEKYVVAITFVTLVTDIQFDMTNAIDTVAKVDIVKDNFNYEEHFRNAVKYIIMLIISIIIMSMVMYPIYKPDLLVVGIFLMLHIMNFIMYPFANIKMRYLELKRPFMTTSNMIIANIIRTIISFFPTPFCTIFGQLVSYIYINIFANVGYDKLNSFKDNKKKH